MGVVAMGGDKGVARGVAKGGVVAMGVTMGGDNKGITKCGDVWCDRDIGEGI